MDVVVEEFATTLGWGRGSANAICEQAIRESIELNSIQDVKDFVNNSDLRSFEPYSVLNKWTGVGSVLLMVLSMRNCNTPVQDSDEGSVTSGKLNLLKVSDGSSSTKLLVEKTLDKKIKIGCKLLLKKGRKTQYGIIENPIFDYLGGSCVALEEDANRFTGVKQQRQGGNSTKGTVPSLNLNAGLNKDVYNEISNASMNNVNVDKAGKIRANDVTKDACVSLVKQQETVDTSILNTKSTTKKTKEVKAVDTFDMTDEEFFKGTRGGRGGRGRGRGGRGKRGGRGGRVGDDSGGVLLTGSKPTFKGGNMHFIIP